MGPGVNRLYSWASLAFSPLPDRDKSLLRVGYRSVSQGRKRLRDRLSDDQNAQDLSYFYTDNIIMPGWRIILCLFITYEFNFFAKMFCSYPQVANGNAHANLAHLVKHKGCHKA